MIDLPSSLLERIFPLQETVLKINITELKDRYDFISVALILSTSPLPILISHDYVSRGVVSFFDF